jgi:type II restriction/modification system DNA methylase subunit YeeA
MEPLRHRWADVQGKARDIIARRDAATGGAKTTHQDALRKLLLDFDAELAHVRVLDPACGSGNFLYVALRRLLDLEKEVIAFAAANGLSGFFPSVDPVQLHGIEVNVYAHELASVAIWIGYIQWLQDNGFGLPSDPVLKPLHAIEHMDAVLSFDEQGQPAEPSWPEADVIVGNPPFLGGSRMRAELGQEYVEALRTLYKDRVPGGADLVAYWFDKARQQLADGHARRVGLLATQGIRSGLNREVLERIKQSGDIFLAWSDRLWVLEGAAVQVSMVGFDRGEELTRVLDGAQVPSINSTLRPRST